MESGLSVTSRAEVTSRFAKADVQFSKKDQPKILDQVVAVTGWSRDIARRRRDGRSDASGHGTRRRGSRKNWL
jgi:hypothetical protein